MHKARLFAFTVLMFTAYLVSMGCKPSPTPIRLFPFLVEDSGDDSAQAEPPEPTPTNAKVPKPAELAVGESDARRDSALGKDVADDKTAADMSASRQVIIEPAVFWYNPNAEYKGIHPAELQQLADHFHDVTVEELGEAYSIVGQPGPGVIRIRTSITNLIPLKPDRALKTDRAGHARLAPDDEGPEAGLRISLGRAAIKGDILDSESDKWLVGFVDQQDGTDRTVQRESTWADIQETFSHWGKRLRQLLDEQQRQE